MQLFLAFFEACFSDVFLVIVVITLERILRLSYKSPNHNGYAVLATNVEFYDIYWIFLMSIKNKKQGTPETHH